MIYILDRNPTLAAKMLGDETLIKQIPHIYDALTQVTAHVEGMQDVMAMWAASSRESYEWLREHIVACVVRYRLRFNRHHNLAYDLGKFGDYARVLPNRFEFERSPPQTISRRYRGPSPVEAYRTAYFDRGPHHWSKPDSMPNWFSHRLDMEISHDIQTADALL